MPTTNLLGQLGATHNYSPLHIQMPKTLGYKLMPIIFYNHQCHCNSLMTIITATTLEMVECLVHFHIFVKMAIIFIFLDFYTLVTIDYTYYALHIGFLGFHACCGVSLAPNVVLTTLVSMALETLIIQANIVPCTSTPSTLSLLLPRLPM